MKQKLLSFLISFFYINGRPKTRLGYIAQPLLAITGIAFGAIAMNLILNSMFPSCEAMLKTKTEFLRISENKKALEVEAGMKRGNCTN